VGLMLEIPHERGGIEELDGCDAQAAGVLAGFGRKCGHFYRLPSRKENLRG
jgi:hypothetical protein